MITYHRALHIRMFMIILCLLSTQIQANSRGLKSNNIFKAQSSTEADIVAIRKMFQQINTLKLTKHHFTYESSGCVEDGVVDYFLNNKEIVKITESGSIGDGSWVKEYYYSNGKVIFCFEKITGGPAIGKVITTEYRYYVKNGSAIRVMEGSKIIKADSKATETIKTAANIYKAYATKDFAGALCN